MFQTNPLENEILISGIPIIETSLISDCESYDICMALSLVDQKDKSAKQFSTGFLRIMTSKQNKENFHIVELQPTNITIKKGEKIRVSFAAAAWPAIGVNPGFYNNHQQQ